MRGERPTKISRHDGFRGSSPHARGTLWLPQCVDSGRRFIPACAGNANLSARLPGVSSVHPRMRGERVAQLEKNLGSLGSSPHARGTRRYRIPRRFHRRFIPACAGNASMWETTVSIKSVHPRMRGERLPTNANTGKRSGSSPHARGTPGIVRTGLKFKRFIPACAGNAGGRSIDTAGRPVHPRMRGERPRRTMATTANSGSSPHARGTRLPALSCPWDRRFIPACAGNALPISY